LASEQFIKDGNTSTVTGHELEEQDNKVISSASFRGNEQKAIGFTFHIKDCIIYGR